jgi:glycosyltransferase involved in cell wall biosynthesis
MTDICFITHAFGGGVEKYINDLINLNKNYNILIVSKFWESKFDYNYYRNGVIVQENSYKNLDIKIISKYKVIHFNSLLPYNNTDIYALLNINAYKIVSVHDLALLCAFQHQVDRKVDPDRLIVYNAITKSVNKIICVSHFIYELFKANTQDIYYDKLCVINNPDITIKNLTPKISYNVDPNQFRVACIGSLNLYKGLVILSEVQKIAKNNNSKLDFLLIGRAVFHPQTSVYNNNTFNNFIQTYKPHLLWFPTICDESYSYTYTLALASGIPIFSSHKGAFIERSKLSDIAYTFKTTDSNEWYKLLLEAHKHYIKNNYVYKLNHINFTVYPNEINNIYKNKIT